MESPDRQIKGGRRPCTVIGKCFFSPSATLRCFLTLSPFFFKDIQSADEVRDNNWISDQDILQGNVSGGDFTTLMVTNGNKTHQQRGKSVRLTRAISTQGFGRGSRRH